MKNHPLMPWLILHHAPKLTHRGARRLLNTFQHPSNVINASKAALLAAGLKEETIAYIIKPNWVLLERECLWAEQPGQTIINYQDPQYPALLREISDPPLLLYISGEPGLLSQPQLAMVGSRNPSFKGRELAIQFAANLASMGWVVTSGMAMGIDAASHEGALQVGGATVAVLGSGLQQIYPKRNQALAKKIAMQGALISEFPLQARPNPRYFPQRNRIISGLSLGTFVVEAALRSGSLITAKLAAEQGREVFALPGSVHNPLAKGCHWLIRQGAKLVESCEDISEELPPLINKCTKLVELDKHSPHDANLEPTCRALLKCIDFEQTSIEQLVNRSGLSVADVSAKLLILELHGYISRSHGGYVRVAE